jgi:TolB-like protein/AraC-like DNA-binding protein/thioredoxin-like negative regulator of GroEL
MEASQKDLTIAVLPFVNMSASEETEYFSDGMTEEIINALAKIGQLKVTSRTSSFFFKGKNIPITKIGNELNVSTILEGSVRLANKQMRITAQLVDVADDFHFWSETWDRELKDIFEIQDEISLIIADKLREHFGHLEIQEHLVEKQTASIDAYEFSMKAKFLRNKWNPEDVKTAVSLYQKALELDPGHQESYVGLADCYSFLGTTGFMPFQEAWEKTIKYTRVARELNSQSSGVHYQLSNQAFFTACDYGKSLREMQKAIELNPNNAEAQQFLSFLYIIAGNREKALDHIEIAHCLNPLSDETHFFRAYYHYMIEDYPKALELLDLCLSANEKNIPAHSIKPLCLLKLGRYDEVLSYFDQIPADVVIEGEKTGAIGLAYILLNDAGNAARYLEILSTKAKEPNGFTEDSYLFMMHALKGDKDKAFDWVQQAIEKKSSLLLLRYTDPLAAPIKKDPRYEPLKLSIYRTDPEEDPVKQKSPLLDSGVIADYSGRLIKHITENKPYLNPDLSLRDLARQVDIHPNHLSWILNNSIGKNFNEFINSYRIEEFKSIAKTTENRKLTIEGLAYESGFNSKTVFNTSFRKATGLTPKQFLNQEESSEL